MNCPKCRTAIGPLSSPDSIVTCPGCGSRLMTKAAARRSQGMSPPPAAAPGPAAVPSPAEPAAPAAPAPQPERASQPAPVPAWLPTPVSTPVASPVMDARATPGPGPSAPAPNPALPSGSGVVVGALVARREATPSPPSGYEQVLAELRAVRELQERTLALLERAVAAPAARNGADEDGAALSPIRAPRRRSVLLLDDDETTRAAAVRELEAADVPVRAFADGRDALRAIAEDKPDVIVLELGLGGEMAGKDIINLIKATMEWVDVPIVLWTREPVANQREARQIHGADEIVPKSAGAAGLVARVITVFRRG